MISLRLESAAIRAGTALASPMAPRASAAAAIERMVFDDGSRERTMRCFDEYFAAGERMADKLAARLAALAREGK